MGVGHFQVIAEHLVVADLERGDAGALALALLQRGDVLLATIAEPAKLIQLGVEPRPDDLAVGQERRRALGEPLAEPCGQVGQQVEAFRRFEQGGAGLLPRQGGERLEHVGQPEE